MEKGKIILIVVAVGGMIAAVIFFAFLVKHPVNEENQAVGLPVSPPQSFGQPAPGTVAPASPASTGALSPGTAVYGAQIPSVVSAGASVFLPPSLENPQASVVISGSVIKPPSSIKISALDQATLNKAISQLNLKDQNGNPLSSQQLLAGQGDLPPALKELYQKPGGPTAADIEKVAEQGQAQLNAFVAEIKAFKNSSQTGIPSGDQCNQVFQDLQNFVSKWGSAPIQSLPAGSSVCGVGQLQQFGLPSL